MRFLLTALFWIGVVSAFMPADFYMSESVLARSDVPVDQIGAQLREIDIPDIESQPACDDHRELCSVLSEFSDFAGFFGGYTLNKVETALNDHMDAPRQPD